MSKNPPKSIIFATDREQSCKSAFFSLRYRQLTETDILNLEDVTKSDLLSAFASIKRVNEQREDQRFIHSNGMNGHIPQEVYEPPGFTSGMLFLWQT